MALIPVALGVVTLTSLMIHTVPGDPVDAILSPYATQEEKVALRKNLGLDQSISDQLLNYFKRVSHGDLGSSLMTQKPVTRLILERAPATIELAIAAMLVAISIGIPLGFLAAIKANSFLDFLAMGVALLGVSLPTFWVGPMLVLIFALHLDWLPVSERGSFLSYILPACTMGIALAAILARMTRNSVLDNIHEDYVRTARAKGTREWKVLVKHVFKNAALPLITIIGLQFGVLLTGAVITEKIFDWPGLGTLMIEGLNNRDYPVVQGCVLVFAMTYVLVNLITDLAYGFIDPRIRVSGGSE